MRRFYHKLILLLHFIAPFSLWGKKYILIEIHCKRVSRKGTCSYAWELFVVSSSLVFPLINNLCLLKTLILAPLIVVKQNNKTVFAGRGLNFVPSIRQQSNNQSNRAHEGPHFRTSEDIWSFIKINLCLGITECYAGTLLVLLFCVDIFQKQLGQTVRFKVRQLLRLLQKLLFFFKSHKPKACKAAALLRSQFWILTDLFFKSCGPNRAQLVRTWLCQLASSEEGELLAPSGFSLWQNRKLPRACKNGTAATLESFIKSEHFLIKGRTKSNIEGFSLVLTGFGRCLVQNCDTLRPATGWWLA